MAIALNCARCGKQFQVAPAHVGKRRFCTPACREAWRAEQVVPCQTCGTPFHTPPSRLANGARFCSAACRGIGQRQPLADRFWPKVAKTTDGSCWLWMGWRNEYGYGRMGTVTANDGRQQPYAHRIAWELTNGPIPDGMDILHRCDNPACCRPDHLMLGDQRANNADRDAKNRGHRGERTGGARLTEQSVRAIRALAASDTMSNRQIAALFGVSHATVDDAVNRATWQHVV